MADESDDEIVTIEQPMVMAVADGSVPFLCLEGTLGDVRLEFAGCVGSELFFAGDLAGCDD